MKTYLKAPIIALALATGAAFLAPSSTPAHASTALERAGYTQVNLKTGNWHRDRGRYSRRFRHNRGWHNHRRYHAHRWNRHHYRYGYRHHRHRHYVPFGFGVGPFGFHFGYY